jgi:hypothetical protein
MYTSAGLAKKYGLEHYLDKPAELNDAIIKLMLLQETMQLERARKKKREDPGRGTVAVKRIAYGKFIASCSADQKFRYGVETAFKASTDIVAVFQWGRFVKALRSMGIPEEEIEEYSQSVSLEDDTHCIDQE